VRQNNSNMNSRENKSLSLVLEVYYYYTTTTNKKFLLKE